jgi:Phage integrase, N-terminal SAM-like domain
VVTVGGWLEHWLATRTGQRVSTLRGYGSHVRLYLVPYLGRVLLSDLTTADVQAMLTALGRAPGRDGKPGAALRCSRPRVSSSVGE